MRSEHFARLADGRRFPLARLDTTDLSRRALVAWLAGLPVVAASMVACAGAQTGQATATTAVTTTKATLVPSGTARASLSASPTATAEAQQTVAAANPTITPSPAPSAAPDATPTVALQTTASSTTSGSVLYVADFAKWPVGGSGGQYPARVTFDPKAGAYHIVLTDASTFYSYPVYVPGSREFTDFTLSVDAKRVAGPAGGWLGVVFRVQPRGPNDLVNAHYNLLINPDAQKFSLNWTDADDKGTNIGQGTASAIHKGDAINEIQVTTNADRIAVAINGVSVGSYSSSVATTGAIGVIVLNAPHPSGSVDMEAAFDHLIVTAQKAK